MKETIEKIIDNNDIDDFGKLMEENGYTLKHIDSDEDREFASTNVTWYDLYEATKDGETFKVRFEGNAIAEISYERWVATFGYNVTDYSVEAV